MLLGNETSPMCHEIRQVQDIPEGSVYTQGLPDDWQVFFAVLHDADKAQVHVLLSRGVLGQPLMFELKRRLIDAGLPEPFFVPASSEIIHLVHARERKSTEASLNADDATGVESLAQELIELAVERAASDIHIETRSNHADIFFRIHGERRLVMNISAEMARALGVVLYSVYADASSKEVTWDPQQVMDGAIEYRTGKGLQVQLRFSSAPIHPTGNFHFVIRVLLMHTDIRALAELGYSEQQQQVLDRAISSQSGLVLLCGPTNSGKSTSLQAMVARVRQLRGETLKIISVEDPVEYLLPGACQIGVARRRRMLMDEQSGSVFTTYLRGSLRQDPDVVMVGEIRDRDSASVVKDLVLSGRKVLTTLHTYSALWAFVRLRELGLPMELLTMPGFVNAVIYQRLIPELCSCCSLTHAEVLPTLEPGLAARIELLPSHVKPNLRFRGKGCASCEHTGIQGRRVASEMVVPDKTLLSLILNQQYADAEAYWIANGGETEPVTGLDHALTQMALGQVDPSDVEAAFGLITGGRL